MQIGGIEVKRRVWVTLLFAVGCIGVWWLWIGTAIPVPMIKPVAIHPSVLLDAPAKGPDDSALREQAEYLDPTPFFFPTKWNYAPENITRQPEQIFGWFDPKLVFSEQNIKSYSAESTTDSANLAEVVRSGNEAPFAGIGEHDIRSSPLVERGGFLEVSRLRDGKTMVAQKLDAIPGIDSDFSPVEFLVSVGAAGLNTDPVLMSGSGREDMEAILRTYLAKSFHVGDRLSPGLYRILIGP